MLRIAISGKFASGKTAVAGEIVEILKDSNNGAVPEVVSFSSKIKEIAVDLFEMKHKDRDLLLSIGNAMRQIDDTVWIKYLVRKYQHNKNLIIIDDLRFPLEYEYLKKHNYILIRLEASEECRLDRIKELYGGDWESHWNRRNDYSETCLDEYSFDYVIKSEYKDETILELKEILLECLVKYINTQLNGNLD